MKITLASNINTFRRELKKADQTRIKTAKTAVRIELYRLGNKLRGDIRSGKYASPGLSAIAWWTKGLRMGTKPLMRLYPFVGYRVAMDKTGLTAELGFVGNRVTARWRRIITRLQSGFTTPVSKRMREWLIHRGIGLSAASGAARNREARYFFLRRTTRQMKTPARNIIEPFWADNYHKAWRNIKSNYLRKMAGERI